MSKPTEHPPGVHDQLEDIASEHAALHERHEQIVAEGEELAQRMHKEAHVADEQVENSRKALIETRRVLTESEKQVGAKRSKPAASNDLAQSERFIATARELGADESMEAFNEKLKKVAGAKVADPMGKSSNEDARSKHK